MPLFSVVIPAYNCEKYLENAVDSVRRQPCGDTEIILVDDGSADSAGKICDRLTGEDESVRVIHQENRVKKCIRSMCVFPFLFSFHKNINTLC